MFDFIDGEKFEIKIYFYFRNIYSQNDLYSHFAWYFNSKNLIQMEEYLNFAPCLTVIMSHHYDMTGLKLTFHCKIKMPVTIFKVWPVFGRNIVLNSFALEIKMKIKGYSSFNGEKYIIWPCESNWEENMWQRRQFSIGHKIFFSIFSIWVYGCKISSCIPLIFIHSRRNSLEKGTLLSYPIEDDKLD